MLFLAVGVLFVTVMCSFTIAGIIGFGGNLISTPILSFIMPVKDFIPAFAVISFGNSLYQFITYRKALIWSKLLRIVAVVVCGSTIGLWAYNNLPEVKLKIVLGLFVMAMAIYNISKSNGGVLAKDEKDPNIFVSIFYELILFCGGIIQGAFICGGPLFVIYYARYFGYDRKAYLGMQWTMVFFNSWLILGNNIMRGSYNSPKILMLCAAGICGLFGAFYWQRRLAGKISDKALFKAVNIVLCFCAVLILYQAYSKM
ncbi:MAG: sulfite exporter TauE/SafE family protein [Phascolarctobacterium sp.]|nr:sulfite exporter TauE/SafE family protein [Phascolarctobacterium sp.]